MYNNSKDIPRFFVDAMLGNIAKKLRILGYDTKYFASIEDNDLVDNAKRENRIIISKDGELIRKAKKLNIKSIFLVKNSEDKQLFEIINQTNIKKLIINGSTARCPKCNFETILIKKDDIKNCIPKGVLDFNDIFWRCDNCNQIYWEGTHIKNLKKLVDGINERL